MKFPLLVGPKAIPRQVQPVGVLGEDPPRVVLQHVLLEHPVIRLELRPPRGLVANQRDSRPAISHAAIPPQHRVTR